MSLKYLIESQLPIISTVPEDQPTISTGPEDQPTISTVPENQSSLVAEQAKQAEQAEQAKQAEQSEQAKQAEQSEQAKQAEQNLFYFVLRLSVLFRAFAESNFSPEQIQFDSLARCISGEDSFENLSLFTQDPKNYDGSSQSTDEFLKENQQKIQDVIAGIEEFSITVTDSGLLADQLKDQYDNIFFQKWALE